MGISNLLLELKDMFRYFFRTPEDSKNITFYTERKGHYPFYEGIINELLNKKRQAISYVTSDLKDPILKTTESKIKPFYIKKLLMIFFSLVNCKVFVMTLTDLNQFHLKRSVHKVHYVYVFHSLVSTHMAFRRGSFDHYDSILCPGPQQLQEIRKSEQIYKSPPKKLVEAGYYRLEELYEECRKYRKQIQSKRTVLIAPSWGDKNILESCGEKLVSLLLDAGYYVIVRPHSETVKHNPEIIDSLKKMYSDNPDFELEILKHSNDSLLKADVLICDYSGIAISYAFGTERPVLYIDVPKKIKNPKYEEIGLEPLEISLRSKIGVVLTMDKVDEVAVIVAQLIKDKESYSACIADLRGKNIYAFGKSGAVGANHIIEVLRKS